MKFTDLAKSYVRTIVPLLVGLVISLALRTGIDLHGYTPEVTAVVTAGYYMAARAAEHYLSPRFGWLLGIAAAPAYSVHSTPPPRTGTAGHATIKLTVDTSQARAALHEIETAAKQTAASVKDANATPKPRRRRSGAAGHSDLIAALVVVLIVVIILAAVGLI